MMLIVQLRGLFVFVCTRGVAKVNSELQDLCILCLVVLASDLSKMISIFNQTGFD